MTMERYTRCSHCRTVYLRLVSGSHGYHTSHRDDRYCPECLAVVREALQHVPPKFECAWVETTDVRLEQVLTWEGEAEAEAEELRAQGKIVGRRVTSPLFDLTGQRQERSGIVHGRDGFKGRTFEFRYWVTQDDDTPTDIQIREEVEVNLETGQTRPWRL